MIITRVGTKYKLRYVEGIFLSIFLRRKESVSEVKCVATGGRVHSQSRLPEELRPLHEIIARNTEGSEGVSQSCRTTASSCPAKRQ